MEQLLAENLELLRVEYLVEYLVCYLVENWAVQLDKMKVDCLVGLSELTQVDSLVLNLVVLMVVLKVR